MTVLSQQSISPRLLTVRLGRHVVRSLQLLVAQVPYLQPAILTARRFLLANKSMIRMTMVDLPFPLCVKNTFPVTVGLISRPNIVCGFGAITSPDKATTSISHKSQ